MVLKFIYFCVTYNETWEIFYRLNIGANRNMVKFINIYCRRNFMSWISLSCFNSLDFHRIVVMYSFFFTMFISFKKHGEWKWGDIVIFACALNKMSDCLHNQQVLQCIIVFIMVMCAYPNVWCTIDGYNFEIAKRVFTLGF